MIRMWSPLLACMHRFCVFFMQTLSHILFSRCMLKLFIPLMIFCMAEIFYHLNDKFLHSQLNQSSVILSWSFKRIESIRVISFKEFIYLFIFRERGREGERERNINVWFPLARPLLGNLARCPGWESNQWLFGSQAGTQSTEPHRPGLQSDFWMTILLETIKFIFNW